jgi:hypothetical protein
LLIGDANLENLNAATINGTISGCWYLRVHSTGTIVLGPASLIDASGAAIEPGTFVFLYDSIIFSVFIGLGAGTVAENYSGGGSYGGSGGSGTTGNVGIPYGALLAPNITGSKGGNSSETGGNTMFDIVWWRRPLYFSCLTFGCIYSARRIWRRSNRNWHHWTCKCVLLWRPVSKWS